MDGGRCWWMEAQHSSGEAFLDKAGTSRQDSWMCGGGRQLYRQASAFSCLSAGRGKSQRWLMGFCSR